MVFFLCARLIVPNGLGFLETCTYIARVDKWVFCGKWKTTPKNDVTIAIITIISREINFFFSSSCFRESLYYTSLFLLLVFSSRFFLLLQLSSEVVSFGLAIHVRVLYYTIVANCCCCRCQNSLLFLLPFDPFISLWGERWGWLGRSFTERRAWNAAGLPPVAVSGKVKRQDKYSKGDSPRCCFCPGKIGPNCEHRMPVCATHKNTRQRNLFFILHRKISSTWHAIPHLGLTRTLFKISPQIAPLFPVATTTHTLLYLFFPDFVVGLVYTSPVVALWAEKQVLFSYIYTYAQ